MKARPTIKELINVVVPRVAPIWHDIAVGLDIEAPQLKLIATDNANDSQRCCMEMFCYWLESRPDASWENLIHAIKVVDLSYVATDVAAEKKLLGNLCSYRCYLGVCLFSIIFVSVSAILRQN